MTYIYSDQNSEEYIEDILHSTFSEKCELSTSKEVCYRKFHD